MRLGVLDSTFVLRRPVLRRKFTLARRKIRRFQLLTSAGTQRSSRSSRSKLLAWRGRNTRRWARRAGLPAGRRKEPKRFERNMVSISVRKGDGSGYVGGGSRLRRPRLQSGSSSVMGICEIRKKGNKYSAEFRSDAGGQQSPAVIGVGRLWAGLAGRALDRTPSSGVRPKRS